MFSDLYRKVSKQAYTCMEMYVHLSEPLLARRCILLCLVQSHSLLLAGSDQTCNVTKQSPGRYKV